MQQFNSLVVELRNKLIPSSSIYAKMCWRSCVLIRRGVGLPSSCPYILKNIAAVFKITRPPLVLALWKTTIFIAKRGAKAIMQEGDMHEG
jgi:hypothetical protein